MRTEEIYRIRRTAGKMFDAGDVDAVRLFRAQTLCSQASIADFENEHAHRDRLIVAALDVLFGGGNAG